MSHHHTPRSHIYVNRFSPLSVCFSSLSCHYSACEAHSIRNLYSPISVYFGALHQILQMMQSMCSHLLRRQCTRFRRQPTHKVNPASINVSTTCLACRPLTIVLHLLLQKPMSRGGHQDQRCISQRPCGLHKVLHKLACWKQRSLPPTT